MACLFHASIRTIRTINYVITFDSAYAHASVSPVNLSPHLPNFQLLKWVDVPAYQPSTIHRTNIHPRCPHLIQKAIASSRFLA